MIDLTAAYNLPLYRRRSGAARMAHLARAAQERGRGCGCAGAFQGHPWSLVAYLLLRTAPGSAHWRMSLWTADHQKV